MTAPTRKRYGGRDWHHVSVHALMEDVSSDRDPLDVVRERAREMVDGARKLGWSGPPFDPIQLASIEGIRVRASDGPMDSDALIRALEDGCLEIVWNAAAVPTRRNFSICHELGHTLFPDAYDVVRHRSTRRRDLEDELEGLCDAAAAELLMPAHDFARDLRELDFNGAAVRALARSYGASPEATARRIASVTDRPCAAIVLTMRLKPTEERRASQTSLDFGGGVHVDLPKFRVDYAAQSASFGLRFPPHKSIPDDSCVYGASDDDASAVETWSTGSTSVRLRVHPLDIPDDEKGRPRALALVVPA